MIPLLCLGLRVRVFCFYSLRAWISSSGHLTAFAPPPTPVSVGNVGHWVSPLVFVGGGCYEIGVVFSSWVVF